MGNVNGSCTSAPPSTPPITPIQPTTNTNNNNTTINKRASPSHHDPKKASTSSTRREKGKGSGGGEKGNGAAVSDDTTAAGTSNGVIPLPSFTDLTITHTSPPSTNGVDTIHIHHHHHHHHHTLPIITTSPPSSSSPHPHHPDSTLVTELSDMSGMRHSATTRQFPSSCATSISSSDDTVVRSTTTSRMSNGSTAASIAASSSGSPTQRSLQITASPTPDPATASLPPSSTSSQTSQISQQSQQQQQQQQQQTRNGAGVRRKTPPTIGTNSSALASQHPLVTAGLAIVTPPSAHQHQSFPLPTHLINGNGLTYPHPHPPPLHTIQHTHHYPPAACHPHTNFPLLDLDWGSSQREACRLEKYMEELINLPLMAISLSSLRYQPPMNNDERVVEIPQYSSSHTNSPRYIASDFNPDGTLINPPPRRKLNTSAQKHLLRVLTSLARVSIENPSKIHLGCHRDVNTNNRMGSVYAAKVHARLPLAYQLDPRKRATTPTMTPKVLLPNDGHVIDVVPIYTPASSPTGAPVAPMLDLNVVAYRLNHHLYQIRCEREDRLRFDGRSLFAVGIDAAEAASTDASDNYFHPIQLTGDTPSSADCILAFLRDTNTSPNHASQSQSHRQWGRQLSGYDSQPSQSTGNFLPGFVHPLLQAQSSPSTTFIGASSTYSHSNSNSTTSHSHPYQPGGGSGGGRSSDSVPPSPLSPMLQPNSAQISKLNGESMMLESPPNQYRTIDSYTSVTSDDTPNYYAPPPASQQNGVPVVLASHPLAFGSDAQIPIHPLSGAPMHPLMQMQHPSHPLMGMHYQSQPHLPHHHLHPLHQQQPMQVQHPLFG